MSRKKSPKRKAGSLSAVQKVEKELVQIPSKLAAQLEKDIKSLKQKENSAKNALNKNKNQINTAEKRIKTLEKNKHTSSGKKQLSAAQKTHAKILKAYVVLEKELAETNHSLETVAAAQAKLIALHKHLKEFEKQWVNDAKKAKVKVKAKIKVKNKPKKSANKTTSAAKNEPRVESFETMEDDIMVHDTEEAEVTS